ncbi:MAG TPA: hypothetical protein VFB62_26050 [Polyangiaceae bacterium]|nr:hypothetical protein [Polyangiaceae bacterium]
MSVSRVVALVSTIAIGAALPVACSDDIEVVNQPSGATNSASNGTGASIGNAAGGGTASGGASASGGSTASSGGGTLPPPTDIAPCQGHVYACGDLVDNDMDGLVDYQDPDCLGPCDNTEDSYYGGIPGQNNAPCKADCYFDQDTGPGNDDCYWSHECDPNEVAPTYYPEPDKGSACEYNPNANIPGTGSSCSELYMTQSQQCLDYCGPLTPNGCDCFGCCELPSGSAQYVYLGSIGAEGTTVCTDADVTDPTLCHPCLPVQACFNDCETCELCVGKTTLPPECFDPDGGAGGGGNPGQCPPGLQACGLPGQDPCPAGTYCITGCCQELPN